MRGKNIFQYPETPEFKVEQEDLNSAHAGGKAMIEHFKEKCEEWIDYDDVDLDSMASCLSYLYDIDEDVRDAYMAEYETVV